MLRKQALQECQASTQSVWEDCACISEEPQLLLWISQRRLLWLPSRGRRGNRHGEYPMKWLKQRVIRQTGWIRKKSLGITEKAWFVYLEAASKWCQQLHNITQCKYNGTDWPVIIVIRGEQVPRSSFHPDLAIFNHACLKSYLVNVDKLLV